MAQKQAVIHNPLGIHARPANQLVAAASGYTCDIVIYHGEKKAKAASIVGLLKLGLKQGDTVSVVAEGETAAEAVEAIASLLETVHDHNGEH